MKTSHNVKESEKRNPGTATHLCLCAILQTIDTQTDADENTTFSAEETKCFDEADSSLCEANSPFSVVSGNKTQTDENTVSYKAEKSDVQKQRFWSLVFRFYS